MRSHKGRDFRRARNILRKWDRVDPKLRPYYPKLEARADKARALVIESLLIKP